MRAIHAMAMGLLMFAALGCAARQDWIQETLVTVDVTGAWTGSYNAGTCCGGSFSMTLRQDGPRVTGELRMTGSMLRNENGPVEGTVRGDVLSFRQPDGRIGGEMMVKGDEMQGSGYGGSASYIIRLKRQ
jgi:hypothetical protein